MQRSHSLSTVGGILAALLLAASIVQAGSPDLGASLSGSSAMGTSVEEESFAQLVQENGGPVNSIERNVENNKSEVIVLGTIHSSHRTSELYSLKVLESLVRRIDPDYILAEIPPDRFAIAAREFAETDSISEPRVRLFPEYVDVIFPLTRELDFELVPTAGWTEEMATSRRAKLKAISEDPDREAEWTEYNEAWARSDSIAKGLGADDDPRIIHTDAFDDAAEIGFATYNRLFNEELGLGGWDNINRAHYRGIAEALDTHRGKGERFLITYGSGHKGWFLRELRKRDDVKLLDVPTFLDQLDAQ